MKKYYTLALLLMISEGHRKIIIIIIINALCKDHDTLQNDAYASKLGGEAVNPLISLQLTLSPDWIGSKGRGERHGITACLSDHSGDDDQCPGSHFYSV